MAHKQRTVCTVASGGARQREMNELSLLELILKHTLPPHEIILLDITTHEVSWSPQIHVTEPPLSTAVLALPHMSSFKGNHIIKHPIQLLSKGLQFTRSRSPRQLPINHKNTFGKYHIWNYTSHCFFFNHLLPLTARPRSL